jgi:hypothetical protein
LDTRNAKPVYFSVTEARPHGWSLDLKVESGIKPETYFRHAARDIYTSDKKKHELKSNFVEVHVK